MSNPFDRTTIEGAARYFQRCVRNDDVDGALGCFDAEAVYIPTLGTVVKGTAEIRKGLEVLCGMKPNLQAKRSRAFEVGDLASWVDEWTLHATMPDGTMLDMTGVSSDIMKRQRDGTWAYLVDNPYGAAVLGDAGTASRG